MENPNTENNKDGKIDKNIIIITLVALLIVSILSTYFAYNWRKEQNTKLKNDLVEIEKQRQTLSEENVRLKTEAKELEESIEKYQDDIDKINQLLIDNKVELEKAILKLQLSQDKLKKIKIEIAKLEKEPIKRTANELLNSIKEKTK